MNYVLQWLPPPPPLWKFMDQPLDNETHVMKSHISRCYLGMFKWSFTPKFDMMGWAFLKINM